MMKCKEIDILFQKRDDREILQEELNILHEHLKNCNNCRKNDKFWKNFYNLWEEIKKRKPFPCISVEIEKEIQEDADIVVNNILAFIKKEQVSTIGNTISSKKRVYRGLQRIAALILFVLLGITILYFSKKPSESFQFPLYIVEGNTESALQNFSGLWSVKQENIKFKLKSPSIITTIIRNEDLVYPEKVDTYSLAPDLIELKLSFLDFRLDCSKEIYFVRSEKPWDEEGELNILRTLRTLSKNLKESRIINTCSIPNKPLTATKALEYRQAEFIWSMYGINLKDIIALKNQEIQPPILAQGTAKVFLSPFTVVLTLKKGSKDFQEFDPFKDSIHLGDKLKVTIKSYDDYYFSGFHRSTEIVQIFSQDNLHYTQELRKETSLIYEKTYSNITDTIETLYFFYSKESKQDSNSYKNLINLPELNEIVLKKEHLGNWILVDDFTNNNTLLLFMSFSLGSKK